MPSCIYRPCNCGSISRNQQEFLLSVDCSSLALSNLIQHIDLNMVRALNLTSFTEFDISKNNINELYAQDFKNYPKLKWLDCSNNLIQNIIGNTFQAQSLLEVLNLSENLISFVDLNAFNGLLNLKYLNLSKLHRNYTKRKKDIL